MTSRLVELLDRLTITVGNIALLAAFPVAMVDIAAHLI